MEDAQEVEINPDYKIEEFEGEILLYSVSSASAVYLNDTAHLVWLLCQEDLSVGEMILFLEEKYPEQKDHLRGDLTTALETLIEQGVVLLRHE